MSHTPSFRAQLITRRTYNRPLDDEGVTFETWEMTVDRVIQHQRWLWERAKGSPLGNFELAELDDLRLLMLDRKVSVSGRTLWLGGTDVAKTREASQFNCSFARVATVYDVVDAFWLLLQGCGVGFEPVDGTLSGFAKPVEVSVIRSTREVGDEGGPDYNTEGFHTELGGATVWHLTIGDSAEAWSKSIGKLLRMKTPVDRIVLDFSRIRAAGIRLKGYGWISSGDETFSKAMVAIAKILSDRAGKLLTKMNILDVMNWLGTTLSSRRSAEIAVMPSDDPEALTFAVAKKDHYENGNPQRGQSNNSLLFWMKPSKLELKGVFQMMLDAGGSEPGFINAAAAKRRAPWFKGVNPCAEILLGDKSFCNLVEIDMAKFGDDILSMQEAARIAARANYRQTCVNLRDGVLSDSWHELNEFLRLTGVGLTGIVKWMDSTGCQYWRTTLDYMRYAAKQGANTMADELGLPRSKATCTVKPSGTLGKIMDTTEGVHRPIAKYLINNIRFSKKDPLVNLLQEANYKVFGDPYASDGVLVALPVVNEGVNFGEVDGLEVDTEPAIHQLNRYKMLMDHYVDHNCSITISYTEEEIPEIVDWLYDNWGSYVGVSWLLRQDVTKSAQDLGFPYLPQEVITKEAYDEYVSQLLPVNIDQANSMEEMDAGGCSTGACPIR